MNAWRCVGLLNRNNQKILNESFITNRLGDENYYNSDATKEETEEEVEEEVKQGEEVANEG